MALAAGISRSFRPPCAGSAAMHDWKPIATAPHGRDLELSVIERGEIFALVFPCRRSGWRWIDAESGAAVAVDPTHWRDWPV